MHWLGFLIQRKKGGISLFPASERSMHFNSNPLQVDLSASHGPEREGKGIEREGGRQGGYWREMGHEADRRVAPSGSFGHLRLCHIVVLSVEKADA